MMHEWRAFSKGKGSKRLLARNSYSYDMDGVASLQAKISLSFIAVVSCWGVVVSLPFVRRFFDGKPTLLRRFLPRRLIRTGLAWFLCSVAHF